MPNTERISELDRGIEALQAAIAALRRAKGRHAREMDRLLAEMARLKARRTRLMMRQPIHTSRPRGGGANEPLSGRPAHGADAAKPSASSDAIGSGPGNGGRDRDRTCGPRDVNTVLYR